MCISSPALCACPSLPSATAKIARYNREMKNKHFTLWHALLGSAALVLLEWFLLYLFAPEALRFFIIFAASAAGAISTIYVSTEVIEEVRSSRHMILMLSVIVAEFVVFFAFEYLFLLNIQPDSFPTLSNDPISLLLHSVMVFVFNPLYLPATRAGQTLLFINTLGAIGLVVFILQNLGQFRSKK